MPVIVNGRPDFGNRSFGLTYLKKFPPYVYGTAGNACLVHKVLRVECRWYDPEYDHLVRRDTPRMSIVTMCQQSFYLSGGSVSCMLPKSDAVLCGRCHGTGPNFRRGLWSHERLAARGKLGCVLSV